MSTKQKQKAKGAVGRRAFLKVRQLQVEPRSWQPVKARWQQQISYPLIQPLARATKSQAMFGTITKPRGCS